MHQNNARFLLPEHFADNAKSALRGFCAVA